MGGHIAAIYRHPVKGFTPEAMQTAELEAGRGFPCDRLWAVENGPSGYDPQAPVFIPKQKFTVLASLPRVAAARTCYDEASSTLFAEAEGLPALQAPLAEAEGRDRFAAWLEQLLGDERRGPLRVVEASGAFRFFDHPRGDVSIVNLASVRDLGRRLGVELDPLRFRANLYVEGWPAWAENDWAGSRLMLGWAQAEVFKPIVRCAAIHVNPSTAERDLDLTKALFDSYGHMFCGVYVHVSQGGRVSLGDAVSSPEPVQTPEEDAEWG